MADDIWRYAEPDGKQRALTLDDLQRSLAKGLLPMNVPVWRSGFADWTPAGDVPELRASVSSGARIIPPKGSAWPGRPVAQRGGAAATEEEPLSPPSYAPAPKARPTAPALDLQKATEKPAAPAADSPMRSRASTLLIAGGAPAVDRNPESESAPINVPTPGGANEAPNTITRPPPVSDGAAAVVPPIPPPSSGKLTAASVGEGKGEVDDQAETREMPVAQRATLRDDAWDIPDEPEEKPKKTPAAPAVTSTPALDVSSSMLLSTDSGESVPEVVSTSMLLAASDSSGALPEEKAPPSSEKSPDSAEVIADAEVISTREPVKHETKKPPPLRSSRSSIPDAGHGSLRPGSSPAFPRPSTSPSFTNEAPEPVSVRDVSERMGLKSKPPPPDINPFQSDYPPPPRVPLPPPENDDDEKTDPSRHRIRERQIAKHRKADDGKSVVPLWPAVAAIALVGGGAFYLGTASNEEKTGAVPETHSSAPVASTPAASPSASAAAVAAGKSDVVCKLTASARSVAQGAQLAGGLDVETADTRTAVGFAKATRTAAAIELDAASLAATNTVTAKATADIRRVVPRFDGSALTALPESDAALGGVTLQRHAGPVALGLQKGKLVRNIGDAAPEELFTLPAASIDALRVSAVPASQKDAAYTYRAPGSIWLGTTQKGDSPQRIPGLGPQVGSPTVVALDASHVLVAWADRATTDDKWGLRVTAYAPGKGSVAPKAFDSKGGKRAMLAPALVRVDAEHALLLWTEEKEQRDGAPFYEVLAQTLDAKGARVGDSFAVSAADMNGGQPQAAMRANGQGTIAFLVSQSDDTYDVAVAGVECK